MVFGGCPGSETRGNWGIFVVAWQSPLNLRTPSPCQVQPWRRPAFFFHKRMDDHHDEPQAKRFKVRIFQFQFQF